MFQRSFRCIVIVASVVLCGGVPGYAQSLDQISVLGGTVETSGGTTSAPPQLHQPLTEKETFRTGPASLVSLDFKTDGVVTLGEQTEVQILRLSPTPIVWLERGLIKVSSTNSVIQISTKYGAFAPAEVPFAMDLVNSGSGVVVTTQRGALRTQDVETASVVFRAASAVDNNSAVRTYSVNSHVTIQQPTMPSNVFAPPCGTQGGTPKTPAKPPAPSPR